MVGIMYAVAVLTLTMLLAQTIAIWRLSIRVRGAEHFDRRLTHFAEALALLTDTTEAGLATVAVELEAGGRRVPRASAGSPARSSTRSRTPRATVRRIVTATRCGKAVTEIAAAEGMSESEVLLHLGMSMDPDAKGARDGSMRP